MSRRRPSDPSSPLPRAARREAQRDAERLERDAERLFTLSPGGSPERPLVLDSPAQVEPTASSTRCPRHQVPMRVSDHVVSDHAGARLRVAHVVCPLCPPSAGRRRLFFRLAQVN